MRAASAALFFAAALAGAQAADQDCPPIDPAAQKAAEAECRERGGEWARFGIRAYLCGVYSCAPRTRDGGKPCRNRVDCEYLCLAQKPGKIGTEVVGRCAAVVTEFGCKEQVDGGRIIGRVCIE